MTIRLILECGDTVLLPKYAQCKVIRKIEDVLLYSVDVFNSTDVVIRDVNGCYMKIDGLHKVKDHLYPIKWEYLK